MKRFYKEVGLVENEGGYAITLDGKPIKTPAKASLTLPTRALAEAVRDEWAGQGETIDPSSMPMMQFASTAIDRVASRRVEIIEELVKFGDADLLCYRASGPVELVARQQAIWQPLLDWAVLQYGATLVVAEGLMPIDQPDAALDALRSGIERHPDHRLTAIMVAASLAGSLVIGLALAEGRLTAAEAYAASQLDESYQIEVWGQDHEAELRRAALKHEIEAAGRFLELIR